MGVMQRSLEIAYNSLNDFAIQEADVVINIPFQGIGMFSDKLTERIYQRGRTAALTMLPKIQRLVKSSR